MYKILVSDLLEKTGLARLRESGHEVTELPLEERERLPGIIADDDALVVRSGTKVTAELLRAGKRLKVVGRAGIGVDNIDIEAATGLGILVVNAPTANLLSATEHTFALMLAVVRNVAVADADIKSGRWNRKKFVGAELQGKGLGVIGFGRIGRQVAHRARAFDMRILAYDPFLDAEMVRRENAESMTLDELLVEADVVTLHVPLTDETRNLLDADRIESMKDGAILVNCARGGVVDEAALLRALESGQLAGAGLDVSPRSRRSTTLWHVIPRSSPPLNSEPRPAKPRCGFRPRPPRWWSRRSMAPWRSPPSTCPSARRVGPAKPNLRLAEKLGHLASVLAPGNVKRISVEVTGVEEGLSKPLTVVALKGVLARYHGESVNYVNAERVARDRGLEVVRSTRSDREDFPNLVEVMLEAEGCSFEVAGTVFHEREERVVRLQNYLLEFVPKGHLLVLRNRDVPGVVGKLGITLGDAGVNIAAIHLSRRSGGREAVAVVRLDQELPEGARRALAAVPEVRRSVNVVDVGAL